MRATPELQQQQVKNEDVTTEGKAAALLHVQILDAADDRGIYCYLMEKQNILLLWKKKIKFSCSEQKAKIAAKKQYRQAGECQASKQPDLPNLRCICALKAFSPFKCSF